MLIKQRFGQTRDAHQQAVSAGEQRDQNFFDDPILTDDDLANFAQHRVAFSREFFDLRNFMLMNFSRVHPGSFSVGAEQLIERSLCQLRFFLLAQGCVDFGQ